MKRKLFCILLCACLMLTLLPTMGLRAHAESEMKASDDCIAMLKALEGFSAKPYWDYSQYSVGYGTACPSEEDRLRYEAEGISEEEAEMLLRRYVKTSEDYLNRYLVDKYAISLNQNQFDALILFTYNCGTGWIVDSVSILRDAVVSGATGNDFLYPMSRWCFAGGKVQTFLLDRRMKEANVYLNGIYSTAVPENYSYILYNANHENGKASPSVQGYDVNDPVAPLGTATLEGSTFSGWYTAAQGGTQVTRLDGSTRKATLYAHWNESADAPAPTDPSPTEPPAPAEPEKPAVSLKIRVTSDYVNVRTGPGTGYTVVGSVNTGKEMTIVETAEGSGYTWGKYTDGWICLKYTNYAQAVQGGDQSAEPPAETGKQTGTVRVDTTLRIRSGPGTSYSIAGYLSNGARVEILEKTTVGSTVWGKISKGWISMDYVKLDGADTGAQQPETPAEPTEPATPEQPAQPGALAGVVINASSLRIRSAAGTSNSVVGYLKTGDRVEILEQTTVGSMAWGRISKGWISMDYVRLDSADSGNLKTVNTSSLRIRSGAGTGNSIVGYLTMGDRVEILEQTDVSGTPWGRISKGWICLDYVK